MLFGAGLAMGQTPDGHFAGNQMPALQKASKRLTPATFKGRQVIIGKGGGFTGGIILYYLLDDGQLFGRRNRDTSFTFIGQQTPQNTKRVFAVVEEACAIKKTKFNAPGNIYTFVQWRKGNESYKVTWGAADKKVPENYPRFYDSFLAMIPPGARLK